MDKGLFFHVEVNKSSSCKLMLNPIAHAAASFLLHVYPPSYSKANTILHTNTNMLLPRIVKYKEVAFFFYFNSRETV